jgi:ABC-type Fe3+-hydroxamate transport system, periplasmic component
MKKTHISLIIVVMLILSFTVSGCATRTSTKETTITVTDQLGRTVTVPTNITKVTGTHHFGPNVVYALGQGDKLTDYSITGKLGSALSTVDKVYASKPVVSNGHDYNFETVIALNPQVAFVYASSDKDSIPQFENAGIKVVAVKGETMAESYEAIRLIATVLNCKEKGEAYIAECEKLLKLVQDRIGNIPEEQKPRVMFAGPKSVYTVASGDMLDTTLMELAGAVSVSKSIKGYWTEVSPEQVATWNPDVIILGSTLDTYGDDAIYKNSHFKTVKAIKDQKIYSMPSNIGWWDFPAPNCVLGVVWMAKMFYPDKFTDIDMTQVADDFYKKSYGHTFTEMGGKL